MNKLKIKLSENKYIKIGRGEKLSFILGPCAIENEHHALKMAEKITSICQKKMLVTFTNHVMTKIAALLLTHFMVLD